MHNLVEQLQKTKTASRALALLAESQRNGVLQSLAVKLQTNAAAIVAENLKDLSAMSSQNPMYDRLLLNEQRIKSICAQIINVAALQANVGNIIASSVMPNKLQISKISVPLGVVAVIYEARPNVTIDVFSLCFKTANACILKGGKEAIHSNTILVKLIQEVLIEHNIDHNVVNLFTGSREDTNALLHATGLIDVCIPRGSNELINYVRNNAKIPVIETGAGIVHTYFDASGNLNKGAAIINNAKTRRVSVCNALDCLIIHATRLHDLSSLVAPLIEHEVELFVDEQAYIVLKDSYPHKLLHHAKLEDYGREFLAYKMAIKTVATIAEAIEHIANYSSAHSEAIITEEQANADLFVRSIDAAVVYVNTSTAFTDGAQFGLGAEIGISTQKLHARGPMGLAALTSYKWVVHGDGQIRN